MDDNSKDRPTLARRFIEPSNTGHRQYEALRAFFVNRVPSAETATRFGYTPGSFRVLVHQFRNHPRRELFPTHLQRRNPSASGRGYTSRSSRCGNKICPSDRPKASYWFVKVLI